MRCLTTDYVCLWYKTEAEFYIYRFWVLRVCWDHKLWHCNGSIRCQFWWSDSNPTQTTLISTWPSLSILLGRRNQPNESRTRIWSSNPSDGKSINNALQILAIDDLCMTNFNYTHLLLQLSELVTEWPAVVYRRMAFDERWWCVIDRFRATRWKFSWDYAMPLHLFLSPYTYRSIRHDATAILLLSLLPSRWQIVQILFRKGSLTLSVAAIRSYATSSRSGVSGEQRRLIAWCDDNTARGHDRVIEWDLSTRQPNPDRFDRIGSETKIEGSQQKNWFEERNGKRNENTLQL